MPNNCVLLVNRAADTGNRAADSWKPRGLTELGTARPTRVRWGNAPIQVQLRTGLYSVLLVAPGQVCPLGGAEDSFFTIFTIATDMFTRIAYPEANPNRPTMAMAYRQGRHGIS